MTPVSPSTKIKAHTATNIKDGTSASTVIERYLGGDIKDVYSTSLILTMDELRLLGAVMLVLAAAVVAGMLLHSEIYWTIVDISMLVVCVGGGLMLLRRK
jgi:hypothetical protein